MNAIVVNTWKVDPDSGVAVALILSHDIHPEGHNFSRWRVPACQEVELPSLFGCIVSVIDGSGQLQVGSERYLLSKGGHCFLPAGCTAKFVSENPSSLVTVSAAEAGRCRGRELLIRDEEFLVACASEVGAMRWILTPQYLSRRIFLHHDKTLVSGAGHPLSWFHTTMFDVQGLPVNDQGDSVFKMSYNYRTEPNLCYEVEGKASVRMALHPYGEPQSWGPWQAIDGETTYHLNESDKFAEWESTDEGQHPLRNKHEVKIDHGHVSLFCMHNPAPTGAERHSAGEYSEYGDLERTLKSVEYQAYLQAVLPLDKMVDTLSMAKAKGLSVSALPEYSAFLRGLTTQKNLEAELLALDPTRAEIIERWITR